ncbi:MAG: hypothetical protein K8R88_07630 [Armatimonadetes bacterium]|nr:hypothetical protein [Armatimonadota bacterium]
MLAPILGITMAVFIPTMRVIKQDPLTLAATGAMLFLLWEALTKKITATFIFKGLALMVGCEFIVFALSNNDMNSSAMVVGLMMYLIGLGRFIKKIMDSNALAKLESTTTAATSEN